MLGDKKTAICPYSVTNDVFQESTNIPRAGQRIYNTTTKQWYTGDGITELRNLIPSTTTDEGEVDLSNYYNKTEIDNKFDEIDTSEVDLSKYDTATLQAMYNEVLEPSPEHWFVFNEKNKAITGLNTDYEAEYSEASITDLVFPFQINGVNVELIGLIDNTPSSHTIVLPSNVRNVRLPNCIKRIEMNAFKNNMSLVTINIPSSCTDIGDYAFSNCACLLSILTSQMRDDCKIDIGISAFTHCSLRDIDKLLKNVNKIENSAFQGNLFKNIIIPKNVEVIGTQSFGNMEGLNTVTILNPECIIGGGPFLPRSGDSLKKLTIIGYKNSTAQTHAENLKVKFIALDEEVYTKEEVDEKIANIDIPDVDLSDYIPTPETAEIGQTIVVKEVDENGKPISWESADLSTGVKKWDLLGEYTFTEDAPVSAVTLRDLPNYTEFMIYLKNNYMSVDSADISFYINGNRTRGFSSRNNMYVRVHLTLSDCWHLAYTGKGVSSATSTQLEASNNWTEESRSASTLIIKNQYNGATFTKGSMVIYGGK